MQSIGKLILFVFVFVALIANAYAQSPREELQQMVEQLQQMPNDNALREKIIKLAASIEPAPAIPEEAERRMARGVAAFKSATSAAGYQDAAKEFEQAVLAAPWYGDAYFNLGVVQDKAGNYEASLRSLKLAQLASSDNKEVKALMYEVEYRHEKSNSPRGRAEAMLAILRKQYAGPVRKLLICGVQLNKYWNCTDAEARGQNWVDSVSVDAWPKPGVGPVEYKIVGTEGDQIEITLGTQSWPNGQLIDGGFRRGCGKPNGDDPNAMIWVNCPGWANAGGPVNSVISFTVTNNGEPLIEHRYSPNACGSDGCRRAQFILQPNP